MDDLQKINVKVFLDVPRDLAAGDLIRAEALDAFLPIFARWREDSDAPARWVDLADYAHMSRGPGVMIIGHRGNLAVDLADPGPGLLYANKSSLEGPVEARVRETFRRALGLIQDLVSAPEYPAGLVPRPGFWQLTFNDRLGAPNTDRTDVEIGGAVRDTIGALFGATAVTTIREPDPRRRYGFMIHSEDAGSLEQIVRRALPATAPPWVSL
jgi:hypothetical protein